MMTPDQIFAEVEIAKMLTAYAWALDAKDLEASMSLFSDDVRLDYSELGFAPVIGKVALRDFFVNEVYPRDDTAFSSLTNTRIEVKGDTATGGDYFMHYGHKGLGSADPKRSYFEGQHFYEFVKTDGAWKIRSMRVHVTWQST